MSDPVATLKDVLKLELVRTVPLVTLPALVSLLAECLGAATERLTAEIGKVDEVRRFSPQPDDELLDAKEASSRLGMTESWLYQHWQELPFGCRVGKRSVRFSARGIAAYLESRGRNGRNGGEGV